MTSRVSCPCYLRSSCALLYLCRTRGRNSDFLFWGLRPRFSRITSLLLVWCVYIQFSLKKNKRPLAFYYYDQGSNTRLFFTNTFIIITRGSISRTASVNWATKTCNLFRYTAAKRVKAMLRILPPSFKLFLGTNQVIASCVNTDFWLDQITRVTPYTGVTSHVAKQVCFGRVKRTTLYRFCRKK